MMTTFEIGRKAETVAAAFLQRKGCEILAQNWRTRHCEIDIIARKDAILYFCEVKYRSRPDQGYGMDYVTQAKLRQMTFAADCWIAAHHYEGDYQLAAIEVSGAAFTVTNAITDLS